MMRYKQISRSKIEVIEVDIYIYVMGRGLRGFELIIHEISSTHTYIYVSVLIIGYNKTRTYLLTRV